MKLRIFTLDLRSQSHGNLESLSDCMAAFVAHRILEENKSAATDKLQGFRKLFQIFGGNCFCKAEGLLQEKTEISLIQTCLSYRLTHPSANAHQQTGEL